MNRLIELLEESAELYKGFLELEYKKYDTVIKNDIEALDDIVSKEQAYYLKVRGIEQKREKLLESMGYKGKTLKEITEVCDENDKDMLNKEYDELLKIITDVKKISSLCRTLIEVRMHRIDKTMEQLGEKNNTYSNNQSSPGKSKSFILSKKI
jgi:Fe2+ transport system protein B